MKHPLSNKIRCKKCGEVIESKTVHDLKYCSCGAVAVDGGLEYRIRTGNPEDYEELFGQDLEELCGIPFPLLPEIKKSVLALLDGLDSSVVDCLKDELKSDINAAFHMGMLSDEQATYLEEHFVFASVDALKRLCDSVDEEPTEKQKRLNFESDARTHTDW